MNPEISIEMEDTLKSSFTIHDLERQTSNKRYLSLTYQASNSNQTSPFIHPVSSNLNKPSYERLSDKSTQSQCPLCNKSITKMLDVEMITLKKLKPRFLRQIKKQNPSKGLNDLNTRVCYKDLHTGLYVKI
jgi:hypothetical protein